MEPLFDAGPLVEACQRGDRGAFRQLFERYSRRVHATARRVLGGDAAAKDATQQVFLKVWRALPRYRAENDFGSWLYRITVNTCLTERNRRRRIADGEPPEVPTPAPQENVVLAAQVQVALHKLSPKLRAPVVLRYLEGLSYEDIAEVLGVSVGTVGSRLSRAHEALAVIFEKERS